MFSTIINVFFYFFHIRDRKSLEKLKKWETHPGVNDTETEPFTIG